MGLEKEVTTKTETVIFCGHAGEETESVTMIYDEDGDTWGVRMCEDCLKAAQGRVEYAIDALARRRAYRARL